MIDDLLPNFAGVEYTIMEYFCQVVFVKKMKKFFILFFTLENPILQSVPFYLINNMKPANSSCGGTPQSPVRAANACERSLPDTFRQTERKSSAKLTCRAVM